MFSYIEKFKKLPKELQEVVSSPEAAKIISELGERYGVGLNVLVMKIMVKEISWPGLVNYLVKEENIAREQAEKLQKEMVEKLFSGVKEYLGIEKEVRSVPAQGWSASGGKSEVRSGESPKPDSPVGETVRGEKEVEDMLDGVPDAKVKMPEPEPEKETAFGLKGLHLGWRVGKEKSEISIPPPIDIEKATVQVLPKALEITDISSSDEILAKRLKNIIKIFLKEIRDALDTRETLTKEKESGGLGLNVEQAEKIVKLLNESKAGGERVEGEEVKPVKPSLEQIRDVEYEFPSPPAPLPKGEGGRDAKQEEEEKELVSPLPEEPKQEIAKEELEHELAPPPPAKVPEAQPTKPSRTSPAPEHWSGTMRGKEEKKPSRTRINSMRDKEVQEELEQVQVQVKRQPVEVTGDKKRMDDIVKPPSRLQGPVEELGNLDLTNFKRLAENPEQAAKKIKEKIDLLEEESFTKRYQGINAWRNSPIYKVYVALGQQSIKEGKSVEEIIKDKEQKGETVLSVEQFNAILELNKGLRV